MVEQAQQFGKYQVIEELGRGGFATVYRARDITLEREVALKILHSQLLSDLMFVQRFHQEARTLAGLRHPHIVTIYEVGESEDRLYIAMELAAGVNLAQVITERGQVSWEETLALLRPVCEALDYAHSQGVIHRDLKPANILLDKERGPLLTDFGFARLMAQSSVSLSLSGGIVGTPGYIAPEVWDLNSTAKPVDIYALGCIVYEMLTGKVLFTGPTPIQAMRAHDRGPLFPETWPPGLPPGIETVLSKALARDPLERYTSARALWHTLNALQAGSQAAQSAAVAARWRAEAETAVAAGEWGVARMALGRWLAMAPDDPDAQAMQARLEQSTTGQTAESRGAASTSAGQRSQRAPADPAILIPELREERPAQRRRVPIPVWALGAVVVLGVGLAGVVAAIGARGIQLASVTASPTSISTGVAIHATDVIIVPNNSVEVTAALPSFTLTPSPSTTQISTGMPASVSPTEPSAPTTIALPQADAIAQGEEINMRAGPGVGYATLRSYPKGAIFTVQGKDANGEWLKVKASDDQVGWIKATLLQVNIPLSDVPAIPAPPTPIPPTRIPPTPIPPTRIPPTLIPSTPIPDSVTYRVDIVSISEDTMRSLPGCAELARSPDFGEINNMCIVGPGRLAMQVKNQEEGKSYPFSSDARQLYFRYGNHAEVSVVGDNSGLPVKTIGNNIVVPEPGKFYKIVVTKV